MIQGSSTGAGISPVVICDHCGQQITDVNLASVLIPDSNPYPNGNKRVLHSHKGKCHDALEKKEGNIVTWIEMSSYFSRVLKTVNLPPKDLI
jgi:hypothetical protein